MSAIRITPVVDQLLGGIAVMGFPFGFARLHGTGLAVVPDLLARPAAPGGTGAIALLERRGVSGFLPVFAPVRDGKTGKGVGPVGGAFGAVRRLGFLPVLEAHKEVRKPGVVVIPGVVRRNRVIYSLDLVTVRVCLDILKGLFRIVFQNFRPGLVSRPSDVRRFLYEVINRLMRWKVSKDFPCIFWIKEILVRWHRAIDARFTKFDFPLISQRLSRNSNNEEGKRYG